MKDKHTWYPTARCSPVPAIQQYQRKVFVAQIALEVNFIQFFLQWKIPVTLKLFQSIISRV